MSTPTKQAQSPLRRAIGILGLLSLVAWLSFLLWSPTVIAERVPAGRVVQITYGPSTGVLYPTSFALLQIPGKATAITTRGRYALVGPGQLRVGDDVELQHRAVGMNLLCAGDRCAELAATAASGDSQ